MSPHRGQRYCCCLEKGRKVGCLCLKQRKQRTFIKRAIAYTKYTIIYEVQGDVHTRLQHCPAFRFYCVRTEITLEPRDLLRELREISRVPNQNVSGLHLRTSREANNYRRAMSSYFNSSTWDV